MNGNSGSSANINKFEATNYGCNIIIDQWWCYCHYHDSGSSSSHRAPAIQQQQQPQPQEPRVVCSADIWSDISLSTVNSALARGRWHWC